LTKKFAVDLLKELRDSNKKDLKDKSNEDIKDFLYGRLCAYRQALEVTKMIETRR